MRTEVENDIKLLKKNLKTDLVSVETMHDRVINSSDESITQFCLSTIQGDTDERPKRNLRYVSGRTLRKDDYYHSNPKDVIEISAPRLTERNMHSILVDFSTMTVRANRKEKQINMRSSLTRSKAQTDSERIAKEDRRKRESKESERSRPAWRAAGSSNSILRVNAMKEREARNKLLADRSLPLFSKKDEDEVMCIEELVPLATTKDRHTSRAEPWRPKATGRRTRFTKEDSSVAILSPSDFSFLSESKHRARMATASASLSVASTNLGKKARQQKNSLAP
eukprot:TRINITY_DN9867_c0_g1_i1.p1 TRINITY_DN9867_c0_g1~~TRINITY_DN9867_c0_g1_i1.p1  ORF type:complete len:327 (+),score=23.24 TRINITY_DN9867_c0_g1_i1:141-983(+)